MADDHIGITGVKAPAGASGDFRVRYFLAVLKDPLALTIVGAAAVAFGLHPAHFITLLAIYAPISLVAAPIFVLLIATAYAAVTSPKTPIGGMIALLVPVAPRLILTLLGTLLMSATFTTMKINIPATVPYFADPLIADIDRWIHGTDPWRLARSLPVFVGAAVDLLYSTLWFVICLCAQLYVTMTGTRSEFRRFMWATIVLYILLGAIGATLLSSVGPVFYDRFYPGGRFAEFIATLGADPYGVTQKFYMDYLYTNQSLGIAAAGGGISAMPSIHVAVATLTAWYLTGLGRLPAVAGWLFAAAILFGSIYTGWHYAADGYVSAIVATLLWLVSSRCHRLPPAGR